MCLGRAVARVMYSLLCGRSSNLGQGKSDSVLSDESSAKLVICMRINNVH